MLKRKTGRNSNCELCSLWESAETICLWGKGPSPEKLMIVLEAPSILADKGGEFISGPAGKFFKGILIGAGIKDYHVTHAVKCKPPEGEASSASQLKSCKDYLIREIHQVKPQWVMTLGAGALKSLARGKITALHGQSIESKAGDHEFKLYPCFHPAVALRDPTKIPALKQDIIRLGKLIRGETPIGQKEIHWKVIRTMADWNSFIEEFSQATEAAIDTETTGLDREDPAFEVNALQIGLPSGRNFVIPFMVRGSPWTKKFQRMFLEQLTELAELNKIKIVMQNGKFDNLNFRKKYGRQFKLAFDTMLAHHLLDENSPHGLDSTAMSELDAPNWDIDLQTKLGLGDLEKFYKYGCYDVYYTLQLYYIFRARLLKLPGLRRLFYKLVMPAARVFEDVEEDGHFINLDRLQEVEKQLTKERDELLAELNEVAEINWQSPSQIGDLFFNQLKMPVLEKTPGGAPSTAESTLLRLEHPVAKTLMKHRGVEKNLSTYVLGWRELMHGDRLFLSTKLHGTVTGRYASRLHQVPRDPLIRSVIDAPPGFVLVVADYSQIELRLVAMVSGDQRMRMVFQTGGDIHAATASEILAKDPSLLTKEERKMGKPVNFGFIYGMWWKKFRLYARDNYGVEFTDKESEKYRERFFEIYSAIPKWHERMKRTAEMFAEVVSLSGRVRHLPGVNSTDKKIQDEAKRQGINSPIQGFGSGDLKAMAMIEIHDAFERDQIYIRGEVHDSILMWMNEDLVGELIPLVKDIMESPSLLKDFKINMTVPLVADFEIGAWGRGEKWPEQETLDIIRASKKSLEVLSKEHKLSKKMLQYIKGDADFGL